MRFILFLTVLLPALSPPLTESFSVSGTVVDHLTKRPLSKTLVSLIAPNGNRVDALSGPDGTFQFVQVSKGKYSLQAETINGIVQMYRQHDEYSTGIAVGPGLSVANIVFEVNQGASITGKVMDDDGEPVGMASVTFYRKRVVNGKYNIVQQFATQTEMDGAFTAENLPPGIYLVGVSGQPWYSQSIPNETSGKALQMTYPLTFYDGVTDANSATPVTLREGESANLQIMVHATPAVRLTVTSDPQNSDPQNGLMITTDGPDGTPVYARTQQMQHTVGDRSETTILVAPGNYRLVAPQVESSGRISVNTAALSLREDTTIGKTQFQPRNIHGRLITRNVKIPSHFQAQIAFSCGASVPVGQDDTFTLFEALPPGPCEVSTDIPNAAIESLTVNGQRAADNFFQLPANGDVELTIVAVPEEANKIDGVVVSKDRALAGALVLLIPEDASQHSRVRRDQSDSDGTFTLLNLWPGKYTLLAIDNGEDLAYLEPGVIAPYLKAGVPLEIPLKDTQPIRVEVQTRR